MADYVTYWLNLEIPDPSTAFWQKEYSFSGIYGRSAITAASMLAVYHLLDTNPDFRSQYINYYNVSNPSLPVMTDDNFKAYWCGIGNWTQSDFDVSYGGENRRKRVGFKPGG